MDFEIKLIPVGDKKLNCFIKKSHYLKSISRGNKYNFGVFKWGELVGAACFGSPVGKNVNQKYGDSILELKRFVLTIKEKNLASYVLGYCLRYLKQNKLCDKVISYADPSQGHEGIIYKASNFKHLGFQKHTTPYIKYKGKKIYTRNLYGGSEQGNKILKLKKENKLKIKVKYEKPKSIFMYNFK